MQIEKGEDNPILRAKSGKVKKLDKKLIKFIDEMREVMLKEDGVGLAAPQVGVNKRIIICCFNVSSDNQTVVEMINPEILSTSKNMEIEEEGCLSLPGRFENVARSKSIVVKYTSKKGKDHTLKLEGMNARIVQHETDHLDGILFIDRMVSKPPLGMVAHNL